MAIHYQCRCGTNIELPVTMAGQPSKCQVCGWLFTVPLQHEDDEQPLTLDGGEWVERPRHQPEQISQRTPYYSVELGCWITMGSNEEYLPRSPEHPPELLKIEGEDEQGFLEGLEPLPPPIVLDEPDKAPLPRFYPPRPEPVEEQHKTFRRDLADSFVFFLEPDNLITFMMIVVISLVLMAVSFIPGLSVLISILILVMQLAVAGFVFSFFLSVIRETAAGEDELPQIAWISDWLDDLLRPLGHFLVTWLLVLLPALLAMYKMRMDGADVDWQIVGLLAAVGVFFWPALVLAVSIGGGLAGAWPHIIVRTAFSAPLAYLAVWGVMLFAFGVSVLAHSRWLYSNLISIAPQSPFKAAVLLAIVSATLNVYALIVAMRAIGLFYRHFKHRFPWKAE